MASGRNPRKNIAAGLKIKGVMESPLVHIYIFECLYKAIVFCAFILPLLGDILFSFTIHTMPLSGDVLFSYTLE